MFSLALPSPYRTQEPILGLTERSDPVFMNNCATSCAGMSVCIDRMTARSSTCFAIAENTSLTSIPDWPYLENLNGDAIATPFSPGNDLPLAFVSSGLGSQVSTCDGAPA